MNYDALQEFSDWLMDNDIDIGVDDPYDLDKIAEVTDIDLEYQAIPALPEAIGSLENLESLYLSGCGLRELPESICDLENLSSLAFKKFINLFGKRSINF